MKISKFKIISILIIFFLIIITIFFLNKNNQDKYEISHDSCLNVANNYIDSLDYNIKNKEFIGVSDVIQNSCVVKYRFEVEKYNETHTSNHEYFVNLTIIIENLTIVDTIFLEEQKTDVSESVLFLEKQHKCLSENGTIIQKEDGLKVCMFDDGYECELNQFYVGNCTHNTFEKISLNDAISISNEFILNSTTYQYDGFNLKFVKQLKTDCEACYLLYFSYESNNSGYGNKSNQINDDVKSMHFVEVLIEKNDVKNILVDNKWDLINEQFSNVFYLGSFEDDISFLTDFIQNHKVYLFDGVELEFISEEPINDSIEYTFIYSSTYGGYINFLENPPKDYKTAHEISIRMKENIITFALIDNNYDMLNNSLVN